jgi:hypothetical protein
MICAIESLQRAGEGFSRRTKRDFVLRAQKHHCKHKSTKYRCCDNPSNDSPSNESKSAFSISVSGYFPLDHALRHYNTSKVLVPSPPSLYERYPSWGEYSGQPAYATRLSWTKRLGGQDLAIGGGGYYSRHLWGFGRSWSKTTCCPTNSCSLLTPSRAALPIFSSLFGLPEPPDVSTVQTIMTARPEALEATLGQIDRTYGSFGNYLRDAVKLSNSDLARIR